MKKYLVTQQEVQVYFIMNVLY